MKNRIKYLDGLRFFAILSIILIHVNSIFRYQYFNVSIIKFFIMNLFDSFTRAGIPLFFMLTGILMFTKEDNYEDYPTYFKKRVMKLIVPYIFFSLVYYVFKLINNDITFSVYDIITEITSGQAMYHLWFMPVIILIYIFIPFLKKLILNLNKKELETLILLVFIIGNVFCSITVLSSLFNHPVLGGFQAPNLLIYINYLFMGYYLYKYDFKITAKLITISLISFILMPIFTTIISRAEINDFFVNATSPLVVCPSVLLFLIFKKNYSKIKLPKFIENFINNNIPNVFFVYLWHVLIMTIFDKYLREYTAKFGVVTDVLLIILYYLLTVVFSFLAAILMNKIKKIVIKYKEIIATTLINIFIIIYISVFSIIYINLIINKYNFIKLNYIYYIIGLVITIALFYIINKYKEKIFKYKILNILMCIFYVIFQILFIRGFTVKPSWDFGTVYDIAVRFATGKENIVNEYYLYMCDNNIGIATLLSLIFKFFYIIGIKDSFLTIALTLNCIFIDISLIFTYLTMRKIEKKLANSFFIFCLFFTPLICYLPIFYTDTFTLPFVAAAIYYLYNYLFIKKKNVYLVISGLIIGIGGILKPTVLIILVAVTILLILKSEKSKEINYYKFFTIILLFVSLPLFSYKVYVKYCFDSNRLNSTKIPANHYVMMGLTNNGGFTQEDYEYTSSIEGIDNKKIADNKLLKQRLSQHLKKRTYLSFLNRKLSYTWTDGTFFAGEKLRRQPKHKNNIKFIKSSDNSDIIYWTISNVEWSILILLMTCGTILRKYLKKEIQDMQLILNMSTFGLILFLLVWETRSRYLINFIPIFLLSGYIGLQAILNYFKSKKNKVK